MSTNAPLNPGERHCPHCGAIVTTEAKFCWLCGDALPAAGTSTGVTPATLVPAALSAPFEFRLSSMMLVGAMIAVLMGVMLLAPGLGIVASIFLLPAFLRTLDVSVRKRFRGEPFSPREKAWVFGSTILIVLVVLVAVAISLMVICTGIIAVSMGNIH